MQSLDRLPEMISTRILPQRMGWQGGGEQGERDGLALNVNISEALPQIATR